MSVPTLRWLQIHQYEQFNPVRIEFSDHENLILGVNGAGKTRLLKLLRAVLSLNFGGLRDQAFDVEFELITATDGGRGFPMTIRGRVRGEAIEDFEASAMVLSAELNFEAEHVHTTCALKNGEITVRERNGEIIDVSPYRGDGSLIPPPNPSQTIGELMAATPTCRSVFVSEADQEFQTLTQELEFKIRNPSLPERRRITLDRKKFGFLLTLDLFPLLFRIAIDMDTDSAGQSRPLLIVMNDDVISVDQKRQLEVLNTLQGALSAQELRFVSNIVRIESGFIECRGVGIRVRFLNETELADTELTFGQRRFLYAGLMLLFHPEAPFLIDEVDNGLHPRLIEALLRLLAGRQFFLASHNKLIIDYTNFDGPADVQRKIHVVERGADGRQTVRVFDDATARTVYEKIAVAIQSPSDVLLAEGLW